MKLSRKLYKVTVGIKDADEITNFDSKNVVAGDAEEAIRKGKSKRKNSFVTEVELLHDIDKL